MEDVLRCVLCGDEIYDGIGNNAQPVDDGRCCDVCNTTIVIPRRIMNMVKSRNIAKNSKGKPKEERKG